MRELEAYLHFCDKSFSDKEKVTAKTNPKIKELAVLPDPSLEELKKISTLEGLRKLLLSVETPLRDTSSNLVFSDGVADSKVMLIGEAPGREEDLQGKPFVGQSGRLLDKIIGSIGLSRRADEASATVYITNVVPFRPPENRTPTREEIDQFLPYLMRHIALVSPEILVLWGATALKALFPAAAGILKERGVWRNIQVEGKSIPTLATFHPAFLLRQAARKREVWEDMKSLKAMLEKLKVPPAPKPAG